MSQKVEGVYPNVDKALQAVDLLRGQGYKRNEITLVANEEVRRKFATDVETDVATQKDDTSQSEEDDRSFWETIKDAFTVDDSYDASRYDAPDYDSSSDPLYEHREAISQGHIALLVGEDDRTDEPSMETDTQPNTVGPEGTRDYDEEQEVKSKEGYPRKDRELTQDELQDYGKKQ